MGLACTWYRDSSILAFLHPHKSLIQTLGCAIFLNRLSDMKAVTECQILSCYKPSNANCTQFLLIGMRVAEVERLHSYLVLKM